VAIVRVNNTEIVTLRHVQLDVTLAHGLNGALAIRPVVVDVKAVLVQLEVAIVRVNNTEIATLRHVQLDVTLVHGLNGALAIRPVVVDVKAVLVQ
jgi:hypothetical protein